MESNWQEKLELEDYELFQIYQISNEMVHGRQMTK
jgi:hypothetical protein